MKSKILLGSVTLLSAFILAACGNGDKKTSEFSEEPSTEVTITADASDETKAVSYTDTQRIGSDDIGYVNIPKDWIFIKKPICRRNIRVRVKKIKNTRVLLNSFAKK